MGWSSQQPSQLQPKGSCLRLVHETKGRNSRHVEDPHGALQLTGGSG